MNAKKNNEANEWLISLDDSHPEDRVIQLPEGYTVVSDDPDFAEKVGGGYALRVTGARIHVRAVDGPVRPRKFKTYASALEAANREFFGGEASFDGIRAFDGITVQLGGRGRWYAVR